MLKLKKLLQQSEVKMYKNRVNKTIDVKIFTKTKVIAKEIKYGYSLNFEHGNLEGGYVILEFIIYNVLKKLKQLGKIKDYTPNFSNISVDIDFGEEIYSKNKLQKIVNIFQMSLLVKNFFRTSSGDINIHKYYQSGNMFSIYYSLTKKLYMYCDFSRFAFGQCLIWYDNKLDGDYGILEKVKNLFISSIKKQGGNVNQSGKYLYFNFPGLGFDQIYKEKNIDIQYARRKQLIGKLFDVLYGVPAYIKNI